MATGTLYVVAAPSGTGKTTLVKALIDTLDNVIVSISHTTRQMRPGEKHGVNYYFVSKDEFERMIAHDDFLEYATVFSNLYGTSKSWVNDTLAKGTDVILEIDWQGHQQIKQLFPQAVSIFILPPSLDILHERLVKRNQDHPDVIKQRIADVNESVSHIHEFDFVAMNDNFEHALCELTYIIEADRMRTARQIARYRTLIADLVAMKS